MESALLRHRLVRQSATNISSSSDSSMPSPQPVRRRRNSQDAKMYRQLSSESLDSLLGHPETAEDCRPPAGRRHSVACGALYVDIQRPNLKSAFNTAVKRMSSACSILSSAPSSTYNLSPHQTPPPKKEEQVLLPHVLGTFQPSHLPAQITLVHNDKRFTAKSAFQVNRRFSTDCPPPTYTEATRPPVSRQKLARQLPIGGAAAKGSLVAVADDDYVSSDERLVE